MKKKCSFWSKLKELYSAEMEVGLILLIFFVSGIPVFFSADKDIGIFGIFSLIGLYLINCIFRSIGLFLLAAIVVGAVRLIQKLHRVYNLCYLPLTEDEFKKLNLSTMREAFEFIEKFAGYTVFMGEYRDYGGNQSYEDKWTTPDDFNVAKFLIAANFFLLPENERATIADIVEKYLALKNDKTNLKDLQRWIGARFYNDEEIKESVVYKHLYYQNKAAIDEICRLEK